MLPDRVSNPGPLTYTSQVPYRLRYADRRVRACVLFYNTLKLLDAVLYNRLVYCFGLNGPLRQYFSLYWAVSQREGERNED